VLAHFAEFGIVVHRGTRDTDRMLTLLGEAQRGLAELAREMLGILAAWIKIESKAPQSRPKEP
jgi:hypothetical protein